MYSSKRNLEAYEHRVEMCRLSFVPESSPDCQVSIKNLEKEAFLDACAAKPGKKKDIDRHFPNQFIDWSFFVCYLKTVPSLPCFDSIC